MALEIDVKRQLILDCERSLLVIGGPGSGKTTIALLKAFQYIKAKPLNRGQQILFLSFSRNARARILQSAIGFDDNKEHGRKLNVQTFHAFFLNIIRTHSYLLGTPKKIVILPPHDEAALKGNRKDDDPTWVTEKENLFFNEGKITFSRFSQTTLELISRSSKIRGILSKTFPLIIVDEAQDTDIEQWQIVEAFKGLSQLILLGDLDQQIFDYRPDINPERLNDIRKSLNPLEVTLESQNYRNPHTEILNLARDILNNTPKEGIYNGVSLAEYNPMAQNRDTAIKRSVGMIRKVIKESTGEFPKSIAILTPWTRGVKIVSNALRSGNIPHRVQFDETATNLSSRLIACLMEPILNNRQHLIWILLILRDFYSAKGSGAELKKYDGWIEIVRNDKIPRGKIVPYFIFLIEEIQQESFSGNPAKDWIYIQKKLLSCEMKAIRDFTRHSEYLIAYNRGRIIMRELTNVWVEHSCYADARSILQKAIIEAQLSSDVINEDGINIMTTYKSKGKEFDGVIIFHNQYSSPTELPNDNVNLDKSRKLLLVALTRACHHVYILKEGGCEIQLLHNFSINPPW